MTAEEYIQLKAFARIDGALLSVMWIASFALYVIGMTKTDDDDWWHNNSRQFSCFYSITCP